MKKQKVCIIGGGLTGLITALVLSKLNLHIDLITGSKEANIKSNRTTAISQDNYNFLKKLKIIDSSEVDFWPCSTMQLYTKNKNSKPEEIFKMNKDKKPEEKILYVINNSQTIKNLNKNIKKTKSINVKPEKNVSDIVSNGLLKSLKFKNLDSSKYNLVIVCTGRSSKLLKNRKSEELKHSYDEWAVTAIVQHNLFKNNTVRQIFFDDEIFAFLPISNTKTSIVWSIKKSLLKNFYNNNKNNNFFRKKINEYSKIFLKKPRLSSKIEYRDLNFMIRNKCYVNRVLLFGDSLHSAHPLVGQGFNMTLRDLIILEKTLEQKLNLGLDIGSLDVLKEFSDEITPRNFVYSIGVDFLRKTFSINDKSFKSLRNLIISNLNKNNFAKDFTYNIANRGLRF